MESEEINVSMLDNVATFSTPLKDCSDYEAILCMIKEEVDISPTEDEADYQNHSNDASRPRARKRDSESRDSDGAFKPPYGLHGRARSKSPGTALISRTKRRSYDDSKNDTRKRAAHRARSLGRAMPGRSLKSINGQQRCSNSHSDTSGFSDPAENDKTFERKNWTPQNFFDCDVRRDCETESEAFAELLTMAKKQVIVKESPYGRNSTVSSQSESTSLAASDPLDTGTMEEDGYVESSQQVSVSDFRQKLLNKRSICDMPKNAETIKRNLHFSDGQETDEENQNLSLTLSPERTPLLNGDVDRNSTSSAGRKRKESQDSIASTLNSMTSDSRNFDSHREASTTPPCPRLGKSSQRDIARGFNSSTPNSYNFQSQREASTASQQSSMSKTSRESTPAAQNLSSDVHDLKHKRKKSTMSQACGTKKTSQTSTSSTTSTLNLTHDLEESESKRETSTTPEVFSGKLRRDSGTSTASTLHLIPDLQDLELKREPSTTPQYSNTSEDSTTSIPKNLSQELQDLDPQREASTTQEPSSLPKTSQDCSPITLKNLTQEQDLDPERGASTAVQPSSVNKTTQDGTLENLVQDRQDFDPEEVARMTLQPSSMTKQCKDSISTLENLAQDLKNLDSEKESSTTLLHPRKRKTSQDSTSSSRTNLTREMQNLDPEKGTIAASPHPEKPTKTNQDYIDSTDRATTNLTPNSCNSHNQIEASATPQSPSMKQPCQEITVNIRESLTQYLENKNFKREPSATPPHSRQRRTSQNSTASSKNSFTKELSHFDSTQEAKSTSQRPKKRKTRQASRLSPAKSPTRDPSKVDSAQEASPTSVRSRERKRSQDSTTSSQSTLTLETENLDPEKEAFAAPLRPRKPKKTGKDSIDDTDCSSESLIPNSCNSHNQSEESPTEQPSGKKKPNQESTVNIRESCTQYQEDLDFRREPSAAPSQNSTASSQKSFTHELSNVSTAQEEGSVSPRRRKRKKNKASTVISVKSPTRDSINVDSVKDGSVTPPHPKKKRKKESDTASALEGSTQDQSHVDAAKEASLAPPHPKKKRKKESDTASAVESSTRDQSHIELAHEASLMSARPIKRKKNKTKIANTQKNVTENVTYSVSEKEPSATPVHLRKRKSTVESPLKGLTPELDKCLGNVDFEQLYEEIEHNTESPSFTFETVELLDGYNEGNPEANKILSKILASPKSKTDEKASRSIEHLSSGEDTLDDPLYLTEAEANEVMTTSSLDEKDKTGTKKIKNKRKRLTDAKSVERNKEGIDQDDTLEEGSDVDPLDYYQTYVAEAVDNEVATTSSSKRKNKTGIEKTRNKRKYLTVDKSFEENKRGIDKDNALEKGSGVDPLDYHQTYIAEAEDNEVATTSSSKRRNKTGTEKTKNKRKSLAVDKSFEEYNGGIDKDNTMEEGSSVDPLEYDSLYAAEPEDSDFANPTTSKRNDKSETNKTKRKRKSLDADKSFKRSKRSIDKDNTLEEGSRRSSRSRKKRETMTVSDWEEGADLSDEAAKVLEKVEAAKRTECLSPRTLEKLDNMFVQLRHEVLPQHDIETRAGTAPLTCEQQMRFLDFASLNKDLYSPEEDEIIKRNWNAFCEDHDWNPENYRVFLQFKHGDRLIMNSMEERRKFVQFLADGLPNRPLYSVYNRFKKIYSEYADAGESYTPEEDKMIIAYKLHDSEKQPETKFAELAKVLRRSRFSIWKRYKILKEKQNSDEKAEEVSTKVEWRLPVVTKFITKLLDVTMSEDLMELKDAFIPTVVWKKLEQKISIDHDFMKRAWEQQFHLQFFSPEPVSTNATKIRLIEYLWMKGIRETREIQWHIVVKYFDGCTISFLRKTFNHMTSEASKVLQPCSLSDIMKWLHETKIDRLRLSKTDRYLPRLRYVDGSVEIVPEDMANVTMTWRRDSLD